MGFTLMIKAAYLRETFSLGVHFYSMDHFRGFFSFWEQLITTYILQNLNLSYTTSKFHAVTMFATVDLRIYSICVIITTSNFKQL
jgi:hypothetical protein